MIFMACTGVFAHCVSGIYFEINGGEQGKESIMPALGFQELLIILAILMLLFGARRLPELAKGLGKSVSEFRKGINEVKQVGEEFKA
jgi:sec-independent protein translocase protein TatA